ncbi:hypothetical protein CLOM_g21607 [Closterium sp. NIES-68]|nr:hypothetical protein CLOM_g21607 [Closterium sp. NIES-68]GJP68630.1 hypothetical protein CLOP_g25305 [Closterium sp. NIES-67]
MAASRLALVSPLIAAHSRSSSELSRASDFSRRASPLCKPLSLPALSPACPRSLSSPAISPLVTALPVASPVAPARGGKKRVVAGARASGTELTSMEGGDGSKATRRVVEHLVYFQVKPDTPPSAIAAMVNGLRALASSPGVLLLTVGSALPLPPALATSAPASPWTHALLGRYESRDALQAYATSEAHVKVVEGLIKPIISDILAVDWETDVDASLPAAAAAAAAPALSPSPPPFSVIHSVVMELAPSAATPVATSTMVSALKAHVGEIPGLEEVSLGENFAPARAKGFTWGFASFHRDEAALKAYAGDERHQRVMGERVMPLVARFNWVDFRVDEAFGEARTRL